jgi:hypothetical protein
MWHSDQSHYEFLMRNSPFRHLFKMAHKDGLMWGNHVGGYFVFMIGLGPIHHTIVWLDLHWMNNSVILTTISAGIRPVTFSWYIGYLGWNSCENLTQRNIVSRFWSYQDVLQQNSESDYQSLETPEAVVSMYSICPFQVDTRRVMRTRETTAMGVYSHSSMSDFNRHRIQPKRQGK